ncbi:MAG: hypothetical protein J7513_08495 [Solirubrobacteraceae bacterium]|nr:hypothetical protein [Solirubrobacteraceae bacterium]
MSRALRRSALVLATICLTALALLPVAAQAAWTGQTSALTAVIIPGVSCPTSTTCVQQNTVGKSQYTTNGGTTWTASAADLTDSTWGLDCPSTTLCFATGDNGNIYKSTNLGVSWTTVSTGTPALYGIACPSTSVCYAVSGTGAIRKTTDGGATWPIGSTQTGGAGLYSVSCPSTTVCYAITAAGAIYKKQAANDTWSSVATSAQISDVISPYTHGISCPSLSVCYVGGTDGTIAKTSDGGANWSNLTSGTTPDIYAISCASDTRCIAVGVANQSSFTDNGGSSWTTENTGSAAAMYSVTWAGGSTAIAGDAIGKPYKYAAPQPPDADVAVSATLNAGTLSFIDGTPGNVTFSTSLNGANQVLTATQPLTVGDATGSGAGWSIAATSTTFTTGSRNLSNTATTVTTAPSLACKASTTCTLATNAVTYPFTLPAAASAPTAQKLYTAAAGTGMGAQTVTPTWRLSVPATTYAGAYTSTWTFTLTSGP